MEMFDLLKTKEKVTISREEGVTVMEGDVDGARKQQQEASQLQ